MTSLQTYKKDLEIASFILQRDENVTKDFFYKQCYPLFKSIYNNYYTDCENCLEFINEIYILILTPSVQTGHCQLENFRGESTLVSWLKATSLFYCYRKYERKQQFNRIEFPIESSNSDNNDRLLEKEGSIIMDFSNIDRMDVETILDMMPCKRYSQLIRLRYMENMTNEETAIGMAMTLDNYYNRHKLAKAQYERCARKEGLL